MACIFLRRILGLLVLALVWLPTLQVRAAKLQALGDDGTLTGPFAVVEVHASLLSDVTDWSTLAGTFGYAFKGGYRWSSWGVFVQLEHNLWLSTEMGNDVVDGAVNIGIGGEFVYADGFVRTSLTLGPSILAFDTILDKAGTTGIFLDVRPVGLRWAVHEYLVIGLDPISFSIVAPVLGGIPLVNIQYRTTVYLEGAF